MDDLPKQLQLLPDLSLETQWVTALKTKLRNEGPRGDRLTANFKVRRELHAQAQRAAAKHGLTLTDVIVEYLERVIDVLQKAAVVEVPGYKPDQRTQAGLALKRRAGKS